jgi:hypothetical protein
MADSWPRAIEALKQAEAGLSGLDPRDFPAVAGLLEKRRAAIERVGVMAAQSPLSANAEGLRLLNESAAAGAALHTRLLVERASLRENMAASQQLRSLSQALAPDRPPSGRRVRCSG